MAKELTLSLATLGWRFTHTDIFLRHFVKQWELLQDVAIKNLDDFWNIEEASGEWLTLIGKLFHVPNPHISASNAFTLDTDQLDDPDVILDGSDSSISDIMYRQIILVQSLSAHKLFSMKNIADNIYQVLGRDNVKVEFIENVDSQDQPRDMYFRMILTFKQASMIKLYSGLQDKYPHLLIGKPMGVDYNVEIQYDPDLGA